jgi:hypothetical protein
LCENDICAYNWYVISVCVVTELVCEREGKKKVGEEWSDGCESEILYVKDVNGLFL